MLCKAGCRLQACKTVHGSVDAAQWSGGLEESGGGIVEWWIAVQHGLITRACMRARQGFLWRDCKPENILLTGTGDSKAIKLADFGLSIDATEERPVTRAGTLDYMAPEVGAPITPQTSGLKGDQTHDTGARWEACSFRRHI